MTPSPHQIGFKSSYSSKLIVATLYGNVEKFASKSTFLITNSTFYLPTLVNHPTN